MVSNYRLLDLLGAGAFGVVYLAVDTEIGRKVAIKMPRLEVLMDPEKRQRFSAEAATAARLDHPGIVQVYEADLQGPTPYIASAYCNGPDLERWLAKYGHAASTWQAIVLLMADVVDAVEYAHQQGVCHRDIKPANILLIPQESGSAGENKRGLGNYDPRLTDFGLAKLSNPTGTGTRSQQLQDFSQIYFRRVLSRKLSMPSNFDKTQSCLTHVGTDG